jgi:hypothetical protein
MVLLALAGLLRPETWLLSAAYWLWLARSLDWPARVRLGALAAAAPALWLVSDLVVTGDALWSSHQTAIKARTSTHPLGLHAIAQVPRHVGSILRVPELVAAAVGVALAIGLRLRRALLPAALLGLAALGAVVLATDGQPLVRRYFFFPAALLAAFAALAVLGWMTLDGDHPARRRWQAGGLLLAVVLVAGVPGDVDRVTTNRTGLRADQRLQSRLEALGETAPARAALRECRPVLMPAGGLIPTVALFSDTPPGAFTAGPARPTGGSVVLIAPGVDARDLPYSLPAPTRLPPGYRLAARNESWVLLRSCAG